jgi:hypothetical protein
MFEEYTLESEYEDEAVRDREQLAVITKKKWVPRISPLPATERKNRGP